MKMPDVCRVARKLGLKSVGVKKDALIRAIQKAEGNRDCYNRGQSATCGQDGCAWRADCK